MRRLPVVLLTAMAAMACGGSHVPGTAFAGAALLTPLSDAEEAHDALLRADLGRADSVAKHGFAAGLASNFADDVLYLRGGLPIVRGRVSATAIVAAESLDAAAARWQPVRAEVSSDGRSGYSYGYTIYGVASGSAPTLRVDRYIAFWRREDAGWRIAGYAETYGAPPPALALPRAALTGVLPDESMPRTRGPLESIRAADAAFSTLASKVGTGRAFGEYAAENAQIFSAPGEFITGPQAISAAFGPANDNNMLTWRPIAGDVAQSGDLGFTVGNAEFTGKREDGTPVLSYSKYFTVWKKQRDGSWRYVVDGGSARPIQ